MELTILKTAFFYYNFTSQNKGSDVSIRILLTLLAALFLFAGCATRQAPEVVIYEEPAPAPVLIPQVEDVPEQSDGWVLEPSKRSMRSGQIHLICMVERLWLELTVHLWCVKSIRMHLI